MLSAQVKYVGKSLTKPLTEGTSYGSIPIIKDIAGEHYLSAHGEYTIERYPQTLGSRSVWIIMITDDGERIAIGYPKKGEELIDLPKDGSRGTIWYSKNSSYILDFIPDEPTDGN